jgi:hypothetical protein
MLVTRYIRTTVSGTEHLEPVTSKHSIDRGIAAAEALRREGHKVVCEFVGFLAGKLDFCEVLL